MLKQTQGFINKEVDLNRNIDYIVDIIGLTKHFVLQQNLLGKNVVVHAIDNFNLQIVRGSTLGLVGESGSGKTTVGRCLLRLVEPTNGKIVINGIDIVTLNKSKMRNLRKRLQMVFQDPADSLNPRFTLRTTLLDALRHAGIANAEERNDQLARLLKQVGLGNTDIDKYSHQFSGGQQQRIAIARALAFNPEFIVLDEPTSSLDVSVKGQITSLLKDIQGEYGCTYLLISHDLSNIRHISDRVAVMYLGKLFEFGGTGEVFKNPLHPYTKVLMASVPIPDPTVRRSSAELQGEIPSATNPPPGCRFSTRCPMKMNICSEVEPVFKNTGNDHFVACHVFE